MKLRRDRICKTACPSCGATFEELTLAGGEITTGLLERARVGTKHTMPCPEKGKTPKVVRRPPGRARIRVEPNEHDGYVILPAGVIAKPGLESVIVESSEGMRLCEVKPGESALVRWWSSRDMRFWTACIR